MHLPQRIEKTNSLNSSADVGWIQGYFQANKNRVFQWIIYLLEINGLTLMESQLFSCCWNKQFPFFPGAGLTPTCFQASFLNYLLRQRPSLTRGATPESGICKYTTEHPLPLPQSASCCTLIPNKWPAVVCASSASQPSLPVMLLG